ncbi:hypothetical protein [Catellatospora tritici]|uniref:hypothetical protein n=1 Tax=Catellatospora tritici TaxID=2851566 RepID=UPI001C2D628A|nr:hypothetical protein [Catellatospora tritici]MBV1855238.1 hypothetical protein [Catellatospora tritici]
MMLGDGAAPIEPEPDEPEPDEPERPRRPWLPRRALHALAAVTMATFFGCILALLYAGGSVHNPPARSLIPEGVVLLGALVLYSNGVREPLPMLEPTSTRRSRVLWVAGIAAGALLVSWPVFLGFDRPARPLHGLGNLALTAAAVLVISAVAKLWRRLP